jgi:hypothetical protein
MQSSGRTYNFGTGAKEPCMSDLPSRVGFTITFLRMAEGEMRGLAEDNPEVASELLHIADQFQGEAEGFAKRLSE